MTFKAFRRCLVLLLVTALMSISAPAKAQVCQPGRTAQIYVGATSQDAACHHDTIQAALNAVGSCPTQVNVTRMHIWSNQHLSTGGRNVTLQGWGDGVTCFTLSQSCTSTLCPVPSSTAPLVTINANGSAGRVLTISGANSVVTLRHLIITGGAAGGGDGGGIGFSGTGRLNLFTTAVNYNNAGYGAGINFKGTGATPDTAVLTLLNESLIIGNTASVSGGGIRIEGQAQLIVESPRTLITQNKANTGFGGGVEVIGPAEAHIGSPGYNGGPVIQQNEARFGGGIAVVGGEGDGYHARLHLYSKDPAQPVAVSGNAAEIAGGGLYLWPYFDEVPLPTVARPFATIYRAQLDDNTAPDGAVAYLDKNVGGLGGAIAGDIEFTDEPPPRGGARCLGPDPCTLMRGNKTIDLVGEYAPDGSLIVLRDQARIPTGKRMAFLDNTAGYLLRTEGGQSSNDVTLQNCLIANNAFGKGALRIIATQYTTLYMIGCTVASNTLGGPVIYQREGELKLFLSIFDQPGIQTLDFPGSRSKVFYVLTNDSASLFGGTEIVQGAPSFVDAAAKNYQLRHDSTGIDFGPALTEENELDLAGNPRARDLLGIPNYLGPRDLGAYERTAEPPPNRIFSDGFEAGSGIGSP